MGGCPKGITTGRCDTAGAALEACKVNMTHRSIESGMGGCLKGSQTGRCHSGMIPLVRHLQYSMPLRHSLPRGVTPGHVLLPRYCLQSLAARQGVQGQTTTYQRYRIGSTACSTQVEPRCQPRLEATSYTDAYACDQCNSKPCVTGSAPGAKTNSPQ